MEKVQKFLEMARKEMALTLATSLNDEVSARLVSPVVANGGILFFTNADSLKYRQLAGNPNCALALGSFFARARARFLGATMKEENRPLREAYLQKFPGAFAPGDPQGGANAEFVFLTLTRLTGWDAPEDGPAPDGVPSEPFDIRLN